MNAWKLNSLCSLLYSIVANTCAIVLRKRPRFSIVCLWLATGHDGLIVFCTFVHFGNYKFIYILAASSFKIFCQKFSNEYKGSITFVKVVQVVSQDSCLDGVTVEKTHTWSTGYIGKLLLDQSWLTKPTSDWTLDLGFCSQVSEFKVREVKSTNICINLQL